MLDLRTVVDDLDGTRAALARRGPASAATLSVVAEKASERKRLIARVEELRATRNDVSAAMAKLDKKGEEFAKKREEMKKVGDELKALEPQLRERESELEDLMLMLPNIPHESVPDGTSEEQNVVVRTWGTPPTFSFDAKDHVAIGEKTGTIDFERAGKISGARFSVLFGFGARLERALINFMLDVHTREHGYTEVWPPAIVKDTAMRGTGQLPKFEADAFRLATEVGSPGEGDRPRHFLVPTAEVPLTNLHADEIIDAANLPIAYTAYTPCFRSEAGAAGKDTRGLIRQHQFDKVELVRFATPEAAPAELEKLTSHAEEILRRLELHHRVSLLCAGDMGGAARKTYDLEVWLPGQNAFREISSCSWFGEYQARRAKIRFRAAQGAKPELLHTLNGSGLAIGRTLVAIYEQYQDADGSVRIPRALVPYVGAERIPVRSA